MSFIHPKRVKQRRKELGLSQTQLGKLSGMTQQAIGQIENGDRQRPKKLMELAQALSCSEDWLLGRNGNPTPPQKVGLISWVQAGNLTDVVDAYQRGDAETWIDYPASHTKMIALRVKGTSMNRVSPEGSVIIIDLMDREFSPNRLYVVKINGQATYKRYRATPPRLEPDSTDAHETIFLNGGDIQCVGRVVRTMMDLE